MKIILAGGTGQVGTLLARSFHQRGHNVIVLARHIKPAPWATLPWDGVSPGPWVGELDGSDVLINLSGRSVNCRYNSINRKAIMDSRVYSTRLLHRALAMIDKPPGVWLNASTATIYRHALDRPMDELTGEFGGNEPGAPDTWNFSIDVAKAWEDAFFSTETPHTRKVALRSAMTLSPDPGGVFDVFLSLVRHGLGGTNLPGTQFLSWIHEIDFIRAVDLLIAREDISGPINLSAPNPVPNRDFLRILRKEWGIPLGLPATRWMLEIGTFLLRTESELVLKSRRVVPTRLINAGFEFTYPTWPEAAHELVTRWRQQHARQPQPARVIIMESGVRGMSLSTTHAQALSLTAFGLDNLTLTTSDIPAPGPYEVLVDLHAASLNYRDLMVALGTYNPKLAMPRILGSDAAGIVTAVGSSVTRFKPGDRVASLFFQSWLDGEIEASMQKSALGGPIDGTFATAKIFPEDGLIHTPGYLSNEEAATLPCAALTAWNALVEKGRVTAGQTVLILGTGGVSLFALQIAKLHGARVLVTSSSDEKLQRARTLGADDTINYRTTPDWDAEVLNLTNGRGVDHVVEVGGAGTLPRSLKSVRTSGHVYLIGVLSDPGAGVDVRPVLGKSIYLNGVYVGSRAMFGRMNAAFEQAKLKPVIDRTFSFAAAREAFEHLQSGSHFGKVVLSLKA
jgi:uncharacterized protein (TIGR01777 family)